MFRKPKKNATKAGLRRKRNNNDDDGDNDDQEEDHETTQELAEARKQLITKRMKSSSNEQENKEQASSSSSSSTQLLHQFEASTSGPVSQKDMATRTNEFHPTKVIDRGNKFLAGPIKAPTNIRTTCRFDYQPDICKDYKDTGFCGFGDTCIYLHDRGDTLSGWQLEQQWQQEQEMKKKKQQEQMDAFITGSSNNKGGGGASSSTDDDDGLPFACYLCRNHFTDPVVTNCGHYFCQSCILTHVQESSNLCPICNKETHGVFHEPTKLLSKKRKISGRDSNWKEFQEACQNKGSKNVADDAGGGNEG